MQPYQHIQTTLEDDVFTLTLNREEKRNAINEQTMDELLDALKAFSRQKNAVLAVLKAAGKDFCAGADLEWMRATQQMSEQELQQQNMKLQQVFQLWFDLPVFTIALVHGNVVGGGIGLVAGSDLVVAQPETRFCFSEVSLGLIPATIAPFVMQRTQSRFIRNAMISAAPFNADEALRHHLADVIADKSLMRDVVQEYMSMFRKNELNAVARCKQLVNDLVVNRVHEPMDEYTTKLLAQVRKSDAAASRIEEFFRKQNAKNENK